MNEQVPARWPGQRLGLPASGTGSIAGFGRRLAAISIDWAMSMALALVVGLKYASPQFNIIVLGLTAAQMWLGTAFTGASQGHRMLGLIVINLKGGRVSVWAALLRTCLLIAVFPAFIWDSDQRGLHDKAAGTALVRSR